MNNLVLGMNKLLIRKYNSDSILSRRKVILFIVLFNTVLWISSCKTCNCPAYSHQDTRKDSSKQLIQKSTYKDQIDSAKLSEQIVQVQKSLTLP